MGIDRLLTDFAIANKGAISPEEEVARFVEAQPVHCRRSQLGGGFEVLFNLRGPGKKCIVVYVKLDVPTNCHRASIHYQGWAVHTHQGSKYIVCSTPTCTCSTLLFQETMPPPRFLHAVCAVAKLAVEAEML